MKRLDGKVAIITGGARGMGAGHVRKFIEEGAKVVFTDILEKEGQALAEEMGKNAKFVKQDVTKAADWDHVVAVAEETYGPVNILVNNAGINMTKQFMDVTEEEYRRILDINQVSVFLGIKAVIPSMRKTEGGSIVNISSMNGLVGGSVGYTDSKFAVRGITKSAALAFAKEGIRVNSVHPGAIETPMIVQEDNKEIIKAWAKTLPLQRFGKPEDVSNLVVFLASDEAAYSTGSEFVIDGGVTAQ